MVFPAIFGGTVTSALGAIQAGMQFQQWIWFVAGIKKPACGRLLGDWLGLFLVNRASLQNVHPDLRPAVGLGQTLVCRVGRHPSRGAGRCANVGRRILSFALDSQPRVRFRATEAVQILDLYRLSGPSSRAGSLPQVRVKCHRNGTTGRRLPSVDHQNTQPRM